MRMRVAPPDLRWTRRGHVSQMAKPGGVDIVEGSGSSGLPKGWTSHPLHASLPALRRIDAAGRPTPALLPLAPLPRRPTAVVAAVAVVAAGF